jgi:hypothetical protein
MHKNALLRQQPFHQDPLKGVGLGKFQISTRIMNLITKCGLQIMMQTYCV